MKQIEVAEEEAKISKFGYNERKNMSNQCVPPRVTVTPKEELFFDFPLMQLVLSRHYWNKKEQMYAR